MQNQPRSREPLWTILKLLKWTAGFFESHCIESPRATAEILLAHALGKERIDLYVHYDQPLGSDELKRFKALIKRRVEREPVAYIIGSREFWSMQLAVNPDVLIPRPETECLVEAALAHLAGESAAGFRRILELGTGSGAVVLALASERPHDLFFASDRSIRSLRLARSNAARHHVADRIRFFCGEWLAPVRRGSDPFDAIVSNPPYIRTGVIADLQPEICRYEPVEALDGGPDGLAALGRIIREAPACLKAGGRLFLEIGYDQKDSVLELAAQTGLYRGIDFHRDYSGLDRVACMQKKAAG